MLIRAGQGVPAVAAIPTDTDRQDTMRSVAAFSIRHKWMVVTAWLFFAVIGAATANTAIGRLDYTYSTPGQPGL